MTADLSTVDRPRTTARVEHVQRRTLAVLAVSQVLGNFGTVTGISVGVLLAGTLAGTAISGLAQITKGKLPPGRLEWHRNDSVPMHIGDTKDRYVKPDGKYTFDKLSSVFITGNATRDDAPNHIRVRRNVPREVAETWVWMCPAGVYEIPEDAPEHGNVDVIVNYTNCVQCGAITAKGGRLTPPEGGDGPLYQIT